MGVSEHWVLGEGGGIEKLFEFKDSGLFKAPSRSVPSEFQPTNLEKFSRNRTDINSLTGSLMLSLIRVFIGPSYSPTDCPRPQLIPK